MRNLLINTLLASVSLAVTAGIVAFSAAPVSAAVSMTGSTHAVVRYSAQDLANPGNRANLDARIRSAAARVCDTNVGGPDFEGMQCRANAVEQARHELAAKVAQNVPVTQNAAL